MTENENSNKQDWTNPDFWEQTLDTQKQPRWNDPRIKALPASEDEITLDPYETDLA